MGMQKWKKILDVNGLPPLGHQSTKDKAIAAWKAKKAAAAGRAAPGRPTKKVNALLGGQSDDDYTED